MLVEKRFDTGEVEINYAEGPNNGPPLVILHGTTARWQNYIPLINRFINRWHVYAPDFRGHGSSGRTPYKYGLRYMYNDTIKFISQVVKEPAHIFGHSLGGRIAIIVAANEMLGLVPAKILECVDSHIRQQPSHIRAFHVKIGHVIGLIEQDGSLAPGLLFVTPV